MSLAVSQNLSELHKTAMRYIENAGGAPEVEWFDDDHAPIGQNLRDDLVAAGMAQVIGGGLAEEDRIVLTEKGREAISAA